MFMNLETPDLFAWTATVILLSILIEKLLRSFFDAVSDKIKLSSDYVYKESALGISDKSEYSDDEKIPDRRIVSPQKLESDIRIRNLTKKFGKIDVFSELAFDIPAHNVTAVTGPSGCGKTTLTRIICGLEKADKGAVPDDCAVVFQEPRLLPWLSAAENVACVSPRYKLSDNKDLIELAKKLLSAFGLPDYSHDFPPAKLSGGMCQRVSIARALISERPLLILDEPFRGLDEMLKDKIISLVRENSDTVLLITHLRPEAEQLRAEILNFENLTQTKSNMT